jgi:hypothetical protein
MRDACLDLLFALCEALSWPAGAIHALLVELHIVHPPATVAASSGRALFTALRDCWLAKGVRELLPLILASPLREAALRRVRLGNPVPGEGCVFAVIHSSWGTWLCAWCRDRRRGLALANREWRHLGDAAIECDFRSLRRAIAHLRAGGRLFAAADVFPAVGGCPIPFLGERRDATCLPSRLAAAAGVPVVAAVPIWRDGRIEVALGPVVRMGGETDERGATRTIMTFVEARILEEPCVWDETLRGGVGLFRPSEARGQKAAVHADRLAGHEGGGR